MKKSIDIQGLPIFSLIDGAHIGTVRQLILQPETGKVQLFLVENDQIAITIYALPYSNVIGVGDFAVTVESPASIQELSQVEGASELVLRGYGVIGTRVMSRKGQLLGTVEEYYVDTETGDITACSFVEHNHPSEVKYFRRPNIMTFGRDIIVIHDEAQITSSLEEPAAEPTADQSATPAALTLVADAEAQTAATAEPTAPTASAQGYLAGKVLSADLFTDAGELLAAQGTEITDELIETVKAAGPTLFMKLNRLAVTSN
ncbi:hypothetical protein CBW65_12275 [Tumebacillus avium]|uniref:PRC-barrel domain-containing protein n=1 Tax=Tumebacillus avium TaxID=1903704 RepID=A0A1Y0IMC3_9BACL|nr:PRC-barrel domain-containing protein [Tumebacillus avium]ARU61712.1 hypothetical protein CBW65_12275 [Tumebacillus avium]